jgi:hypothetical protein
MSVSPNAGSRSQPGLGHAGALPAFGAVAPLAVFAELAAVRIVGPVAVHTAGRHLRTRDGLAMTLIARQGRVLAVERKASLFRVIKSPALPAAGDMAGRAVRRLSEAPLVTRVGMAPYAAGDPRRKQLVLVTLAARDRSVSTSQRELRSGVIEQRGWRPRRIAVAAIAFGAQAAAMNVVAFVAFIAGYRQRDERCGLLVTDVARDLRMRPAEREARFEIVVEVRELPAPGDVALFALVAVAAAMHVVLLVATDAIAWRAVETFIGVTAFALNLDVLADESKPSERMVKC